MQNQTGKIIPGKELANAKQALLESALQQHQQKPALKIFQVGDDPASTLYVSLKVDAAKKIGINAEAVRFTTGVEVETVVAEIQKYNQDTNVHGIMVQSPIPGLDLANSLRIFNAISPEKDVDGLTHYSLGRLWQLKSFSELEHAEFFISATPLAVLDCLSWLVLKTEEAVGLDIAKQSGILTDLLAGKTALVVNRSNIVGKPLTALLEMCNATVTLAHSQTNSLEKLWPTFDFIFLATGVDHFVDISNFNPEQTVIDIGINSAPGAPVQGDVAFKDSLAQAEEFPYLAPVPGGVGPLTVMNLLQNTYKAFLKSNNF